MLQHLIPTPAVCDADLGQKKVELSEPGAQPQDEPAFSDFATHAQEDQEFTITSAEFVSLHGLQTLLTTAQVSEPQMSRLGLDDSLPVFPSWCITVVSNGERKINFRQ